MTRLLTLLLVDIGVLAAVAAAAAAAAAATAAAASTGSTRRILQAAQRLSVGVERCAAMLRAGTSCYSREGRTAASIQDGQEL